MGAVVQVISEQENLSPTLPVKVKLTAEVLDKGELTFIVHLEDSEIEAC
jgi:hypothetical protein